MIIESVHKKIPCLFTMHNNALNRPPSWSHTSISKVALVFNCMLSLPLASKRFSTLVMHPFPTFRAPGN